MLLIAFGNKYNMHLHIDKKCIKFNESIYNSQYNQKPKNFKSLAYQNKGGMNPNILWRKMEEKDITNSCFGLSKN